MKIKLLLLLIYFIPTLSFGQTPNLSGRWTGTAKNNSGQVSKYTLILALIDSCEHIYAAAQIDSESVSKFNMIQINNTLIRDVVGNWSSDINSGACHQKLVFKNNKLQGRRISNSSDYQEDYIYLEKRNLNPITFYQSCNKQTSTIPCQNMINKSLPEEVLIVEDSAQLSIGVIDTDNNDSDLVSIFFGEKKILDQVPIYNNNIYSLPLTVTQDTLITWCACNQGSSGLNTGKLRIVEHFNDNRFEKVTEIPIRLISNSQAHILIHRRKAIAEIK